MTKPKQSKQPKPVKPSKKSPTEQPEVEISVPEVAENTELQSLVRIIEGALFASSVPLSVEGIGRKFPEEEKPQNELIRQALSQIQDHYEKRGICLMEVATGFRFQVASDVVPLISKTLEEKPARYSRALLETLALIAYRQPITRGEIEDIRGVVVSTNIIKTLDEQEWIRIVGYKEVPGKPALYATTKTFLDHFGLKNLAELPPLAELTDLDGFAPEPVVEQSQEQCQEQEQTHEITEVIS